MSWAGDSGAFNVKNRSRNFGSAMGRKKLAALVAIGAVATVLALIGIYTLGSNQEKTEIETTVEISQVPVPINFTPVGTILQSAMFQMVPLGPTEKAADFAIDPGLLEGKIAGENLEKGRPIPATAIKGAVEELSLPLKPGKRILTVNVDEETVSEGSLFPNSRVDIGYVATKEAVPIVIATNQRIFAVNGATAVTTDNKGATLSVYKAKKMRSVSVEVDQSLYLMLLTARLDGTLKLIKRGGPDSPDLTLDDTKKLNSKEPILLSCSGETQFRDKKMYCRDRQTDRWIAVGE